ncbi:MAG: hypothetical protein KZQ70_15435 [gamma proteobacterium symbiont of Lucinoma myriamae]|nr:hypothetical protein [gamma proteobacterium symbiont of Lucinoma myriamae]
MAKLLKWQMDTESALSLAIFSNCGTDFHQMEQNYNTNLWQELLSARE